LNSAFGGFLVPRHSAPQRPSRLRPRLVVTLVVAATGLGAAIWLPTRNDTADASEQRPNTGARFERNRGSADTFVDDFDGGAGSTVDPGKWVLGTGRIDNGLQFNVSTRNARLDGAGNLIMTARDERGGRTSARLITKETFQRESGTLEARIRVPGGNGLTPALDVVRDGRAINVLAKAEPGDFHTYAVTWTPEKITVAIDGADVQEAAAAGIDTDQPFGLALSLKADDDADLPARMVVDFIRVSAPGDEQPSPAPSETASPAPSASASSPPTAPPSATPSETPSETPSATPTKPAVKAWAPFTDYTAGQVVSYEGANYEVLEAHTSLPGWEPTALPSLFKKL
jgi:beta-glucanase (GH16 family)